MHELPVNMLFIKKANKKWKLELKALTVRMKSWSHAESTHCDMQWSWSWMVELELLTTSILHSVIVLEKNLLIKERVERGSREILWGRGPLILWFIPTSSHTRLLQFPGGMEPERLPGPYSDNCPSCFNFPSSVGVLPISELSPRNNTSSDEQLPRAAGIRDPNLFDCRPSNCNFFNITSSDGMPPVKKLCEISMLDKEEQLLRGGMVPVRVL